MCVLNDVKTNTKKYALKKKIKITLNLKLKIQILADKRNP